MACSGRPKGTRFIFEAGVKLKFCDESIATACVYYHKFHQVMKSEDYNENLVVMAVLSLAAKAKEVPVKLSDVVNTCYRCLHRSGPMLEVGDVYWQLKDSVARYELLLLRALRFEIYTTMPHSHLLHYLLALSRWVDSVAWTRSRVPSISLSLLQDTFHTSLPLSLPPHQLATAVLYLAVLCCRLPIPGNDRSPRKWWEVLCPGSNETELQEIARRIMAAYDQEQPGEQPSEAVEDAGRKETATTREREEDEGAGEEGEAESLEKAKDQGLNTSTRRDQKQQTKRTNPMTKQQEAALRKAS